MAIVAPGKPRAQIAETPAGLELRIPTKRKPFILLFLPIWLVGWTFGWVAAFSQLMSSQAELGARAFLLVWISFWTVGGAFAWLALAWSLAGREIVTLGPSSIVIARRL